MSSYTAVHRRIASGPDRASRAAQSLLRRVSENAALGCALAAVLVLLAFVTKGGVELGGNTWSQILLVFLGAGLGTAALLRPAPGRRWGAVTVALFAALAVLTALSIAWSVQPDVSWLEANRTLSYLGAFVAGVALARLLPERWPALVGSVALMATVLGGWALLVKVFPAALDKTDAIARLRAPFGYWNAVGLAAALGLPACLWIGSRRERGALTRGLAPPAIAILLSAILLSYSRSALIAALVGTAVWFAIVPTRLRGALTLAIGVAGAAAISAWALSTSTLTHDGTSLPSRSTAGHGFGVVLLLVLLLTTAGGFLCAFLADRTLPSAQSRRRIGTALLVVVALVPFLAAAGLAASHRGLTGQIKHFWSSVTNSRQFVGDAPGRLVKLSNTRSLYWSDALKVGEHSLLAGTGAGAYGIARGRYTDDPGFVGHAHSYVAETFADLGLLGVGISLALLVAWGTATFRALRPPPPEKASADPEWTGASALAADRDSTSASTLAADRGSTSTERAGLSTLLCVVVVFGVHSAIDWTWFIPGTTVAALLCAGWLAGRGPVEQRGRLRAYRRPSSPRPISARPGAVVAIASVVVLSLLAAWVIWQPLRASSADSAAIAAIGRGNTAGALADARAAANRNPLALEPLWELSAVLSALGEPGQARAELVAATRRQPQNPDGWRELGLYDLRQHNPSMALVDLNRALRLDRSSYQILQGIQQARSALGTPRTS